MAVAGLAAPGAAQADVGSGSGDDDDELIVIDDEAPEAAPGRASSTVTRDDLDERQPRSAPDALRWEPGVYVQQTAAAQGSPYLRGRTGQQTVLLFDGIRLNNATWRQGPNQYFFAVDTRTLAAIDVIRGGASTRYGSDALGGVLDAIPRQADPDGPALAPRLALRWGSADHELGGRAEVAARLPADSALLVGFGGRDVSLLEGGGVVRGDDGAPALVPRLGADGRTQLGTGFGELAWDARWVKRLEHGQATVAYYDHRLYDAPRTDQCAPAFAPADECLRFEEQFHALVYGALDLARVGPLATARLVLSAQDWHERRRRDRPSSNIINGGRDGVRVLGASARGALRPRRLGPAVLRPSGGADASLDLVDSTAWLIFTDVDETRLESRGQYLAGARYLGAGAFAEAELRWGRLRARGGGRLGLAAADSPADAASATQAIDRRWLTSAAHLGAEVELPGGVAGLLSLDRSFRAPNLDDLTGRQATGPGFQFENAALAPETAWTAEAGARVRRAAISAAAFAYVARVDGAIARSLRSTADCPPAAPGCAAAWFRYQLVNLDGPATVVGAEAELAARWQRWRARATLTAARGDGPNPQERPTDPALPYAARVPLSRVPPVGGTVELRAVFAAGTVGAGLRWAGPQRRLAPSDLGDPRIPLGGTPGSAVLELRASARLSALARVAVVLDNVTDAAYRTHGSSINGPGRSIMTYLELTP